MGHVEKNKKGICYCLEIVFERNKDKIQIISDCSVLTDNRKIVLKSAFIITKMF